ncbi:MAG: choice-of-anchor Q domain-containing protein, partial [Verrucomicrobiota bacterium]
MKTSTILLRAGMLALLLAAANSALATNRTITSSADSGDGSLRQKIAASIAGDSIDFDPALNGQTITLTTQIGIAKDITINGPGYNKMAISGNDQTRIFEIASGHTVTISGLRLRNGKVHGAAGTDKGYHCVYDSPIHQYPAAIDPTPGGDATGGAINNAGALTLSNCWVENCNAIGGKGGDSQQLTHDCNGFGIQTTVYADAASGGNGKGGAIYNNGSLNLIDCTFEGNLCQGGQGGQQDDSIQVTHVTPPYEFHDFYPGKGGDGLGGAICNEGILNSHENTFVSNTAQGGVGKSTYSLYSESSHWVKGATGGKGYGGAIYDSSGMTAYNSTFSKNMAEGATGGDTFSPSGHLSSGDGGDGGDGAGGAIKEAGTLGCNIWYCTFSGNVASGGSGGLTAPGFNNGNPGGGYGGGIHTRFDNIITIWSSIVAGNSGNHPDASGVINSAGHNLICFTNGSTGWLDSDLTGYIDNNGTPFPVDPQLGPLTLDNGGPTATMMPSDNSACIDHGGGGFGFTTTTDQCGNPRIKFQSKYTTASGSDGSDIGAVEVQRDLAVPRIWVNPNGGNWSLTNNWSGGVPPGSNDVAVITLAGNYTVTLDVSTNIAGLVLGATVGTNKQTLTMNGQTLTLNGESIINSLGVMNHLGGTLAGSGKFTVQGALNWNSGTISRTGGTIIGPDGTLNITGNGNNHDLPNTTITNQGSIVMTGGTLRGGGTVIHNEGVWDAQADVPISQAFSGAVTVNNKGTLKKSGGVGALALGANVTLKNSGLVDVQSGRVDVNGGGTNDAGVFNAGTNGAVNFNTSYTFNDGTKLLGAGSKQLVAGTFKLNGTITTTNLTQTGGSLTGSPTIDGEFTWSDGGLWSALGNITIAPTGKLNITGSGSHNLSGLVLTNNGTVAWVAGTITDRDSVVYNNGLWDAQSDFSFSFPNFGTPPVFNNAGTFRKSSGSGTTSFDSYHTFNNTGALDVRSGTVSLYGGGANTAPGVFNTTNGATVSFNGNYTFNNGSQITGTGTNLLAAGATTLNGNITFTKLTQTGGALAGTHVLNGNFQFNGGNWATIGSTTIAPGSTLAINGNLTVNSRTLTNNGTVVWAAGTITDSGSLIYNNGLWDAQSDFSFSFPNFGTPPVFNNAGTFRKSAGTGTTTLDSYHTFNNSGALDVRSGTVSLYGSGANTAPGVFNTTNGATVSFNGNYTFNNGSQITGTGTNLLAAGATTLNGNITFTKLTQTGGALAGTHVLNGNFQFNGGNWATTGSTTIAPGSRLAISGSLDLSLRMLTNNGTVAWTAGTITDRDSVIHNNGLWDAQSDFGFSFPNFGTPPVFNNAGT